MLERWQQGWAAPDLEGDDRSYTALVAKTISGILLVAAAVVFIAHVVRGDSFVAGALAIAIAILLATHYLLGRGVLLPISIVVPSFLLLLLSYLSYVGHGVHDVAWMGYPLVVVLAGLLLGKAAPLYFGLACVAAMAFIYQAEVRGVIDTPYSVATDAVDLVSTSAIVGITAILLRMLIGHLTASLDRARRQERALAASNRELERRNDELERFNYTVSHDLRSPLITIRGFLGYVEPNAVQGNFERLRSDIQRITAATDRMDRLLQDLLELSRLGNLSDAPEEVPFDDLARAAMKLLAGPIEKHGVRVRVAPDSPPVHGDRFRLLEVLRSLLDNAVKFMGDQQDPEVELGARLRDGETFCWVRDNGMGIAPEYQEKVFELFETLDPTHEGTGIGLPLARRIVELHGGRVGVDSPGAGQGSTFWFTVPRATAADSPETSAEGS